MLPIPCLLYTSNQSQKQIIMRVSNLLIMGALSALVFTGCTNNDDNSEWLDSNSAVSYTHQMCIRDRALAVPAGVNPLRPIL